MPHKTAADLHVLHHVEQGANDVEQFCTMSSRVPMMSSSFATMLGDFAGDLQGLDGCMLNSKSTSLNSALHFEACPA